MAEFPLWADLIAQKISTSEMELESQQLNPHSPILSKGARVRVPHKGRMVNGKIVRHDKGYSVGLGGRPTGAGWPFYVVDVGEYESIKVPVQKVVKETVEVSEAEMTDAQMKKREEIVKSMKDEKDDFERRYPGRGKEVMYATATKLAMEEEDDLTKALETFKEANRMYGAGGAFTKATQRALSKWGDRAASIVLGSNDTFTVMAIDDANPVWKQGGYNYKPNIKVIDQLHSLNRNEIVMAAKTFRQKYPKATISIENKGGMIVKVFKPGEVIKENEQTDTDYEAYFRDMLKKHGYDSPADIPDDKKDDFFNAVDKGYNATNESLQLDEKNVPTNPELWSRAKAAAKRKFDVYPSAYANGWAAKWYKKHGGDWRTEEKEAYNLSDPEQREFGTNSLATIYKSSTPGELRESAESPSSVVEASKDPMVPLRMQAAMVIAKSLGGVKGSGQTADFRVSGSTPESIVNQAIRVWVSGSHTPEAWKLGGQMLKVAKSMGISWDEKLIRPATRKAIGLAEADERDVDQARMMRARQLARGDIAPKDDKLNLITSPRMQAAMVIAKSLGSVKGSGQTANFNVSGGTPESIVNQAVRVWLSGSHSNEGWALGAKMLKVAKSMGIKWDENLLKGKLGPITIKKLGLAEADAETVALQSKHKQQATALKLQQAREKMSLKQRKLQQKTQKAKTPRVRSYRS